MTIAQQVPSEWTTFLDLKKLSYWIVHPDGTLEKFVKIPPRILQRYLGDARTIGLLEHKVFHFRRNSTGAWKKKPETLKCDICGRLLNESEARKVPKGTLFLRRIGVIGSFPAMCDVCWKRKEYNKKLDDEKKQQMRKKH